MLRPTHPAFRGAASLACVAFVFIFASTRTWFSPRVAARRRGGCDRCLPTSRGLQTLLQVTSGPTPSATMLPGSRRLWHAGLSKPLPPRKARKGFGFDVGFGFGFGFTAPPPHPGPFTRTRHAWRRPHVLPRRSRVCVRGARLCQGHPAGD